MQIIRQGQEKHFLLAALIVAVLAYFFWTGSRYPALDEKAMMSGAIQLEDSLSFEAVYPLTEEMGTLDRIFWSTLNWVNTNKKGMTFGVLFAAAFLTAAGYVRRRSFRGGFANSALGLVIGAPLGVCVNCAAPIAKGMYSAGMRAETTLSAMIASPTLNIVVLTMLFSLLPVYMALMKIGLSLLIILVLVPLICRGLQTREIAPEAPAQTLWSATELSAGKEDQNGSEGLWGALSGVAAAYARNLWYIITLTVPLMLLAGFIGAVVATALPQDLILGLPFSVWALILIALVGVVLPVPIAFDVVMAGALLGLGLAHGYVMALLFTLGTFSVYSFLIVAGSVGMRAAWMIAACVALLGALGGAGAEYYHRWQTERALEMLLQGEARAPQAQPWGAAMAAGADPWTTSDAAVTIEAIPFAPPSPAAATGFTRMEADQRGIDKPLEFSFRDMWPPFWEGRSLSSGDIDRDGDLDLVIASTEAGLYLYENDGTGRFSRIAVDLGPLAGMPIFNAALVDFDNDGWPDLFLASYLQGNWLWRNEAGTFGSVAPESVPNRPDAVLSMALAFADADNNGYLDIALGNWAAGWYRRIPGEESRNRILWTDAGRPGARHTELPGIPGETLSILFSDIDRDGVQDLIVGNDFDIPDYVYLGDGAGGFAMIDHASGMIPHTTTTTMAVKTGDLQNDGSPEIYLAQIAGRSSGVSATLKMQDLDLYCDAIENPQAKAICETNMAIKTWYRSGNNFDPTYAGECQKLEGRNRDECRAMLVKDLAIQKRDPNLCTLIPRGQDIPRAYCELHFLPVRQPSEAEIALTHPQILRSNVLLDWQGEKYADTAEDIGLDVGGWSWDTKFGDYDLDGDMDVYIVNGTWVPNEVSPSNLYFVNDGTGRFSEASGPEGLEDYLMTASATAFDIDNDGDEDFVTHPVNGPLALFVNNAQGARLGFELSDGRGNRDGIGALITLEDETGRTQSRELQLGGGFMSFDAPRATFGLGALTEATKATIRWPDGSATVIDGPLAAGALYRVMRQ
ncbi:RNA-binding protein (plasmid) [Roseovarius faecimaris]|uniref:RNA-binding protein n=1 Tax=Roseovarius faecimaris TaxID=2494550 RepID=A0A6I6IJK4_9RHOB|nr:FG-GAP-like repeat-containing protein [Roseovarius faecimaris]QGX96785.1 RNA-binding protein [Roseovarius faecimaris]